MFDWFYTFVDFWFQGWLSLILYWIPLGFCLVGYTIKDYQDYRTDVKCREEALRKKANGVRGGFVPHLKVGTIVGRYVISVVPIVNFIASIFDVFPSLFDRFLDWLGRVFDIPLVKPVEYFDDDK